jgi:hypothetical protein
MKSMKNERIINAWNKVSPDDLTRQRMLNNVLIAEKNQNAGRRGKTVKRVSVWIAAVIVLVVGVRFGTPSLFERYLGAGSKSPEMAFDTSGSAEYAQNEIGEAAGSSKSSIAGGIDGSEKAIEPGTGGTIDGGTASAGGGVLAEAVPPVAQIPADGDALQVDVDEAVEADGAEIVGTPPFTGQTLTLEEARQVEVFGAFVPGDEVIPSGFAFESAYMYSQLMGYWSKGYDYIEWYVEYAGEPDYATLITDLSEREKYDYSLYSIPFADSVPEELQLIFNKATFDTEGLTYEQLTDIVNARSYYVSDDAGDTDAWRVQLDLLVGDLVVRATCKGVDPSEIAELAWSVIENA